MSNLIVPNIICFQTQKQLTTLSNIGVLLKGVSNHLRARNFVRTKTSLLARCVHAHHRAHSLLSPANFLSNQIFSAIGNHTAISQ